MSSPATAPSIAPEYVSGGAPSLRPPGGTLAARLALRLDTDWLRTFAPEFFRAGPETRDVLLDLIPRDFEWSGKRVMDFGCGVGRTLAHFREEAEAAEIWGVDVSADALRGVEEGLCPPMHAL